MRNEYEIDGDIVRIKLTRRNGEIKETIINLSDFERANEFPYTWFAHFDPSTGNYYVKGNLMVGKYKQKTISFHRWLLYVENNMKVDHINHDTLDNRTSCNLRVVTNAQNLQNRKGPTINNISGVRNVTWHKRKQKWQAQININGQQVYLGNFTDLEEAKKVVEEARKIYLPFSAEASRVVI